MMRSLLLLLLLASPALADPPHSVDPSSPIARWFKSLHTPGGFPCCSLADCRPVAARWQGDNWQAFIDEASFGSTATETWEDVGSDAVLDLPDNPLSRPIACWVIGRVICFVVPPVN